MVGLIVGGLLIALGLILLWRRAVLQKRLRLMSIETSPAADVARMAPGTLVEVKGTLRCAAPLTSEFAGRPCAYYANSIEEQVERWEERSDGKRHRTTQYRTVKSTALHAPFLVEDASGTVPVNAQEAQVEAAPAFDQYYPQNQGLAGTAMSLLGVDSVQGHRYREHVLATDLPVYVLGSVQPDGSIGVPPSGARDQTFRVSHRSEEEQTRDAERSMAWLFWGAVAAFAAGGGFLVWGLLR